MSETPAVRASDAEREQVVARLREATVEGRLTVEEFTDRMARAYEARTGEELAELARDLPAVPVRPSPRRRPTRFLVSIFSSGEHSGRLRVGRRVFGLTNFGNIDLDLRQATIESDIVTIYVLQLFGNADIYVPEDVEVELRGLMIFGKKSLYGADVAPRPGTPLVRVVVIGNFAALDVWRVPLDWAQKSFREVALAMHGVRT